MKRIAGFIAAIALLTAPAAADQSRSYPDGATAATFDNCFAGDLCADVRLKDGRVLQFYSGTIGSRKATVEMVETLHGVVLFADSFAIGWAEAFTVSVDHGLISVKFRYPTVGKIDPSIY